MGLTALAGACACTGLSTASPAVRHTRFATCRSTRLALTVGKYGEAATQFTQTFTFVNATRSTCRLGGWPRFQVANDSSRPVKTTTRRVRQNSPRDPAWKTVVLAPRHAASFDVYGADYDLIHNVACPKTSTVAITPPNNTTPIFVRVRLPHCGAFYVAPVIPGRVDRAAWSFVVR